ncbi:thioredoxin-like protein 1 [Dendronephthya gigantea]|uniref:thioredoxin-like protein 1 n=1 Tax=Dendronephthya gigantea TaxID=151771 RepID=UPI00106B062D|nr:thioredoxin-like protein 1 [Dendronephthya gigantea]
MASSGGVRMIESDSRFRIELTGAKGTLIIANFKASWCGPCQMIAPKFQELSLKYTSAIFLEVDVDACKETSNQYSISGTPTFILFRSGVKLDQIQGSDAKALEDKIKKWMGDYEEISGTVPKGYMDLSSLINKAQCECLNESDDHTLKNIFQKGKSLYLESDCDEQMLISISFNQPVKLHSLRLYAPDDGTAPKTIKIFSNLTRTLGFDEAEKTAAVQELRLASGDVLEDVLIPLKFVKFQYVQSVTLFVQDNQGGEETSIINSLSFIGTTLEATNMSDFKRVAGKEGEAHG